MREIKFRAWDTRKEKMIPSGELMADYRYFDLMVFAANGYRTRVMQYTGLKDKNGKEIYEGDIIVGTYKDMGTDTGLVVFKGCGFKVEIPNVGDDELVDWERYSDSIEVIGNIYENPDLIEGGAD
jgi:uncharacterized phage protein (TIGR01671 family)